MGSRAFERYMTSKQASLLDEENDLVLEEESDEDEQIKSETLYWLKERSKSHLAMSTPKPICDITASKSQIIRSSKETNSGQQKLKKHNTTISSSSTNRTKKTDKEVLSAEELSQNLEAKARLRAEKAIKEKKVFTVVGPYPSLKSALRRRGWVEKLVPDNKKKKDKNDLSESPRELNPDDKGGIYSFMSQIARNCSATLIFTVKASDVVIYSNRASQIVNHYARSSTFTTKAGLCRNLRNVTWFSMNNPDLFYPRCYELTEIEDKETFKNDFYLTACCGMLKFFLNRQHVDYIGQVLGKKKSFGKMKHLAAWPATSVVLDEDNKQESEETFNENSDLEDEEKELPINVAIDTAQPLVAKDTIVPLKALNIAIQYCQHFIQFKENEDLDLISEENVGEINWVEFLSWYYSYVHEGGKLEEGSLELVGACKDVLIRLRKLLPQFHLDGWRNVWILKPGAKSRGRGIECLNRYEEILAAAEVGIGGFVVQKYIEQPFLIHNTKFDMRQWFLVTDWNPLTIWFYSDCYLRFCSNEFTLDTFHASVHLSNNSVQKYFTVSATRNKQIPEDNMWTSDEFQDYLRRNGYGKVWTEQIVPGMKEAIICSLLCTQEQIESRKNAFELYGADFMLSWDLQPWLLEINSSPSMARTTCATAVLVDRVIEDMLKVVLDWRANKSADTGGFQMILRQPMIVHTNTNINLSVHGVKIAKKSYVR